MMHINPLSKQSEIELIVLSRPMIADTIINIYKGFSQIFYPNIVSYVIEPKRDNGVESENGE